MNAVVLVEYNTMMAFVEVSRYQQTVIPYGREMTTFLTSSGEIVQINNASVRAAGADHAESVGQKMGQLILFLKGRLKRNMRSKGRTKHLTGRNC